MTPVPRREERKKKERERIMKEIYIIQEHYCFSVTT